MKKGKRIAVVGISVWLLGLLFALTVAALDTPWIPMSPDATEVGSEQSNESSTVKSEEITAPSAHELTDLESDPEAEQDTSAVPMQNSEGSRSESKKGCGSSLSGIVLFLPLLAFAAAVTCKKSTKRYDNP